MTHDQQALDRDAAIKSIASIAQAAADRHAVSFTFSTNNNAARLLLAAAAAEVTKDRHMRKIIDQWMMIEQTHIEDWSTLEERYDEMAALLENAVCHFLELSDEAHIRGNSPEHSA